MKALKFILGLLLTSLFLMDGYGQLQLRGQKVKINNKVNTTIIRTCNPLNIKSTENILRDKIGRDLVLYMDRDNGYLEIMGRRQDLRFNEYRVNKPGNNWVYYLNDVRSRLVRVSYEKQLFYITLHLEKEGNEIKGKCPGCRVGNDRRAPDINWKDPKIRIVMKPVAYQGSFTMEAVRVDLLGKFDFNGVTDHFLPAVSAYFKSEIAKQVKGQLQWILNSSTVKTTLAQAFEPQVKQLRIGYLKSIDFSKNNIYLCNY